MKIFTILVFFLTSIVINDSHAQVNLWGLPWSITGTTEARSSAARVYLLERPNYEAAKLEDMQPAVGPYRTGLRIATEFDFKNIGTYTYLPSGKKIWRMQISLPEAMAMDAYFKDFYLPQGVTLYFFNENMRQVAGAYDAQSNTNNGIFASPKVEGSLMNIELDIEDGVDLSQIRFTINMLVANYRGSMPEQLHRQFGAGSIGGHPLLIPCSVNATCPIAAPYYENAGKSAVHLDQGGYVCSGNLVNTTAQDCTPIMLTASLCQIGPDTSSAQFNIWKFYFNYENSLCGDSTVESGTRAQFTTGATFLANGPSPGAEFHGSFLLLKLRDLGNIIRNNFSVTFAGWDRMETPIGGIKYINFGYPGGEPKKFTQFTYITGDGSPYPATPNTHWKSKPEVGGIPAIGSSLFRADFQRIIGPVDIPAPLASCDTTPANSSLSPKFHLLWENPYGDGSSAQKLKPWLDPANLNPTFMNGARWTGSACASIPSGPTSIIRQADLLNSINIFPNPSQGNISIQTNLSSTNMLDFTVLDLMGRVVAFFPAARIQSGTFNVNVSNLQNGVYILRVSDGVSIAGKKFVLAK